MLLGLLRLRAGSGGWFDLGRFLWKQVSWRRVLRTVVCLLQLM